MPPGPLAVMIRLAPTYRTVPERFFRVGMIVPKSTKCARNSSAENVLRLVAGLFGFHAGRLQHLFRGSRFSRIELRRHAAGQRPAVQPADPAGAGPLVLAGVGRISQRLFE